MPEQAGAHASLPSETMGHSNAFKRGLQDKGFFLSDPLGMYLRSPGLALKQAAAPLPSYATYAKFVQASDML